MHLSTPQILGRYQMSLGLEDIHSLLTTHLARDTTALFPSFPFHGGYVETMDYALFTECVFSGSLSPLRLISDDVGRCF